MDDPKRKRWTVTEFYRIIELGIIDGEQCELIEGDIMQKERLSPPHALCKTHLSEWLAKTYGSDYVSQNRSIIPMNDADRKSSEPEPDFAVLCNNLEHYAQNHPPAEDVILIIETAEITLSYDLIVKSAFYARNAIVEYWVVDVAGRQIIVHLNPTPEGYESVVTFEAEGEIAPAAHPEAKIKVADLLPLTSTA